MNYSFPYVLKKSDKRLRYLTVTQIKEETVSPYSLYRDPIFDTERTLGLTLLTVFSYLLILLFLQFREDRFLSHTFLSNWKGYFPLCISHSL